MAEQPEDATVAELIHRRRRQVLVHSVLYYRLDTTLVPDAQFDAWALELGALQRDHPQVADQVTYQREAFRDFLGTTGYQLPLDDPQVFALARRLLRHAARNQARSDDDRS